MFVGKSTASGYNSDTNVVLAPPAGAAAGDVFLVSILLNDYSATITPPSVDWVLVSSINDLATRLSVYAIVDPAPPASYAFEFSSPSWFVADLSAYRGVSGSVIALGGNHDGPISVPAALTQGGLSWAGAGDVLLHYAWALNNNGGAAAASTPSIALDAALTDRGETHLRPDGLGWYGALASSDEEWPSAPTAPSRTSTWSISGAWSSAVEVYGLVTAVGVLTPAAYGWGVVVG